jgi:anionic cell wall polymer biosynthesis LytR-Cps2A-Psr (LCP) family protein
MDDVGAINNAIGGVVVDIDTDMTAIDPEFKEGASVLLTDEQAEKYVRARMNVGDGTNQARMGRQRQYMQKAYNLVLSQLRDNPEYINDLYTELRDKVQTDRPGRDLSVITNKLTGYESEGILTMEGEVRVNDTIGEGIEHEEFYPTEASIVSTLRKVMNLTNEPQTIDEEE